MKYLGFTSKALDWFGFYFKKQNIVGSLEKKILNCGVPQGSILDPAEFLLYVNHKKTALKNCFTQMICTYFKAAKMLSLLK